MRVAIFSGHFSSSGYGGGEHHVAQFASILSQFYEVDLYVGPVFNQDAITYTQKSFNVDLSKVNIKPFYGMHEISGHKVDHNIFRKYDVFINMDHMYKMPPVAHRNLVATFFPQNNWDITGYDGVIANSKFTASHVVRRWQGTSDIEVSVVYPPIHPEDYIYDPARKKNIIVSVGRFFYVPDGNNKNHDVMITAFKEMGLADWELHLVGSVQNKDYYQYINQLIDGDPRIILHHDIPRQEMIDLLADAKVYWHAAGYDNKLPSSQEHFGIISLEAQASGAVPVVFNGGGMPESGAITWENTSQLKDITRILAENTNEYEEASKICLENVHTNFSYERAVNALISVIEAPLLSLRDYDSTVATSRQNVFSIKSPRGKKVCVVSDGVDCTTGFGVVGSQIIKGLRMAGFEVCSISLLQPPGVPYNDKIATYRPGGGLNAEYFNMVIQRERPDVMVLSYEIGHVYQWILALEQIPKSYRPKIVSYFPIEGWPLQNSVIDTVNKSNAAATYMNFGAKLYYDEEKKWLPVGNLGIDHAGFRKLGINEREYFRRSIGWDKKFVIGFVGRNKRTKQQGQLLRLTRELAVNRGMADLLTYIHSKPSEQYGQTAWEGWDLPAWIGAYEIEKYVAMPRFQDQANTEMPHDYDNIGIFNQLDLAYAKGKLSAKELIISKLNSLSMVQLYNCFDLFVTMSQGEGFGLPQLEAMASGTPIIYLDDNGAQREIIADAGIAIPPIQWEPWKIGIELPMPDTMAFADAVQRVRRNPELFADLSRRSLERSRHFTWFGLHVLMAELVNKVISET